ncbi:hypothetical protein EDB81DRAFT_350295 [Dactylonectria macrodidyma]|uniref:Uncharacterized protein n=1 Tax=Dactylonectria macrodidyma TaxID=307937 RepID=A0A9P9FID1_9HYPO|nr:hypothetical protein EDB81DRAFT_350295 [Dactylonectria macrodidyma]
MGQAFLPRTKYKLATASRSWGRPTEPPSLPRTRAISPTNRQEQDKSKSNSNKQLDQRLQHWQSQQLATDTAPSSTPLLPPSLLPSLPPPFLDVHTSHTETGSPPQLQRYQHVKSGEEAAPRYPSSASPVVRGRCAVLLSCPARPACLCMKDIGTNRSDPKTKRDTARRNQTTRPQRGPSVYSRTPRRRAVSCRLAPLASVVLECQSRA